MQHAKGPRWTEAYLLHALLTGSPRWEILFWVSWWSHHRAAECSLDDDGGTIWMRRV